MASYGYTLMSDEHGSGDLVRNARRAGEVGIDFIRYHPATIARSAATLALLSGGRFTLGVGAGENPHEHIVGKGWPALRKYVEAGFDHVGRLRGGSDQAGFLDFWQRGLKPRLGEL